MDRPDPPRAWLTPFFSPLDGHLWTAKWWTENDVPGGSAGKGADVLFVVSSIDTSPTTFTDVWENDGTCD